MHRHSRTRAKGSCGWGSGRWDWGRAEILIVVCGLKGKNCSRYVHQLFPEHSGQVPLLLADNYPRGGRRSGSESAESVTVTRLAVDRCGKGANSSVQPIFTHHSLPPASLLLKAFAAAVGLLAALVMRGWDNWALQVDTVQIVAILKIPAADAQQLHPPFPIKLALPRTAQGGRTHRLLRDPECRDRQLALPGRVVPGGDVEVSGRPMGSQRSLHHRTGTSLLK